MRHARGVYLQGIDGKNGNNDSVVSAEVSCVVGDSLEGFEKRMEKDGKAVDQLLAHVVE